MGAALRSTSRILGLGADHPGVSDQVTVFEIAGCCAAIAAHMPREDRPRVFRATDAPCLASTARRSPSQVAAVSSLIQVAPVSSLIRSAPSQGRDGSVDGVAVLLNGPALP